MTPPIETHHLSKHYRGTDALQDVSLSVPAGAVYALVGANGAGKTTLIKLLMNILAPTSGHATVVGFASNRIAGAAFENIGYVSENQELPETMSVRAFLAYMRTFYPQWDRELEARLIHQFDLPMGSKLKKLSRGTKMKAVLASILAYRPSLIVLDEPFSGIDPLGRDELMQSLRERDPGTTILLSSHDLFEIEAFASHIGYLEKGRLLFSEQTSALEDRFREIAVTLPSPQSESSKSRLLASLPATWLQPEWSESILTFIDSGFTPDTPAALAARFPEALKISGRPMTLRSIFLAIAKAGRSAAAGKEES